MAKHESFPPWEDDMMLKDITEDRLSKLGDNLSPGEFKDPPFPVQGWILEPNRRLMVCLNCRRERINPKIPNPATPIIKVWFVINTGSNHNFLSRRTICALLDLDYSSPVEHPPHLRVNIQDPDTILECSESRGSFAEANVLGVGGLHRLKLSIEAMNWKQSTFRLAYST